MKQTVLVLLFMVAWAGDAYALSCARAVLDKTAIERHAIIFEGVVEKAESAGFAHWIKRDNVKRYHFRVTRHWYGDDTANTVDIVAAPGWAQSEAYSVGESYMVFGTADPSLKDSPGVYSASPGWCGFDLYPIEESRTILKRYHAEQEK